jgi:hypothetical protein
MGVQVLDEVTQLARVVLAVAVDLHGDVVVVLERVDVARLHRAADTQVERHAQHLGPAAATLPVASVEPSSTTTTSKSGAWRSRSRTTDATLSSSLYAGTIARFLGMSELPTAGDRRGCGCEG